MTSGNEGRHEPDSRYTSQHTRRILLEAEGALGEMLRCEDLDASFEELAASSTQLSEEELDRLLRFVKLLGRDPQAGERLQALSRDGTFEIHPSEDNMELRLTVRPAVALGKPVEKTRVVSFLRERGIRVGIDEEAVDAATAAAQQQKIARDVVIVRGTMPTSGKPERLLLFVRMSPLSEPTQIETTSDAAVTSGPWLCQDEDLILRRVPPVGGEPGWDALGKALPPPKPISTAIEMGPNVRQEGDDFRATTNGAILFDGRRLEVRRLLVITEELTLRDGAIEFDGDIHVLAGVGKGARIQATGNIRIDGPVEAATIESTGGDVEMRVGVAGQRLAVIRAHGDLRTRYAENATLIAGGSIIIGSGSLHSRLVAGHAILLTQGRGQLIGGSAVAGDYIEAKQIGSSTGVVSDLMVGLGEQAMREVGDLDGRMSALERRRDRAKELADRIERAIGDPAKLKEEEFKAYTALRKVEFVTDHDLRMFKARREELLVEGAASQGGYVSALQELRSRVTIRIGRAVFVNSDCQRRCRVEYNAHTERVEIVR